MKAQRSEDGQGREERLEKELFRNTEVKDGVKICSHKLYTFLRANLKKIQSGLYLSKEEMGHDENSSMFAGKARDSNQLPGL